MRFTPQNPLWIGGERPQPQWRLAGKGQVLLETDRIVLRGKRPRPFMRAASVQIPIPHGNIQNVAQDGPVVQLEAYVDGRLRPLRLYLEHESKALDLFNALPRRNTPEFERQTADRRAFTQALEGIGTVPVITPALVALNVLMFVITVAAGAGVLVSHPPVLLRFGVNFGPETLNGQWWRLFTAMFLHFGLVHLAFNMGALWSLGRAAEKLFGSVHFLLLYLFAGLAGSMTSLYVHPLLYCAGASGAIFGVMGALAAFALNPKTRMPVLLSRQFLSGAVPFLAYNLLVGASSPAIDLSAHLGGLIAGFAMGWLLARPVTAQARERPAPRLILAASLALAALGLAAVPLVLKSGGSAAHVEFRREFARYLDAEAKAMALNQQLDHELNTHSITNFEWGQRLQQQVIPAWQKAEEIITAMKVPPQSPEGLARKDLLAFLDQKRFALDLWGDAEKTNDPEKREWASDVSRHNGEYSVQLKKRLSALYP